ncbi:hypothetical protein LINPERPRIM_LOCUS19469, partial [Linum perenne]
AIKTKSFDSLSGSIFRDHSGRRLACFAANLGNCTIMRAEVRTASIGFKIVWELGYRKVHLQMDSLAARFAWTLTLMGVITSLSV